MLRPLLAAVLGLVCAACEPDVLDFDGDGWLDDEDCGPAEPDRNPDADDPYGDGIDSDCDGADGIDRDGDGYPANPGEDLAIRDCDDSLAGVHPGAEESDGDGVDSDCDGVEFVDSDGDGTPDSGDCDPLDPARSDADGDGDGQSACDGDCDDADPSVEGRDEDGDGRSTCAGDCDDLDATTWPLAPELCDGVDNDCDGAPAGVEADEDGDGARACEGDCDDSDPAAHTNDGDGDGASPCAGDCDDADAALSAADLDQDGSSSCAGDCDDIDAAVHPGAPEACNGADDDCDGALAGFEQDLDGDGARPCAGDCDDSDAARGPFDVDGDGRSGCAGDCDDGDAALNGSDFDGDGSTTCAGDCDDGNAARRPGAAEVCDGLDDDCDGALPASEVDADGDGALGCGGDCDDADPALNPRDDDADGASTCAGDCEDDEPSLNLVDVDGDGASTCDGDCADADPTRRPGAVELCDGLDGDCDGILPPIEQDLDGDGASPCAGDCDDSDDSLHLDDCDGDGVLPCGGDCDDEDPSLHDLDLDHDSASTCDGDCDDFDSTRSPLLIELCDGIDGDCDGVIGPSETDADGDGASPCQGDCDDTDPALHGADADQDGWSPCAADCDDADPALGPADRDADGASPCAGDCDDTRAILALGLPEVCDGLDNDCDAALPAVELDGDGDGAIACQDCDDGDAGVWGVDSDGDGWDPCQGDCNEGNPAARPGAPDPFGDGIDQSCDGVDGADSDGDGWAGNAPSLSPVSDCDDADPAANRDDSDGDGWDTCEGDCDDASPDRSPGAPDAACDGLDTDCQPDPRELDVDGDGVMPCQGDCDDGDPLRVDLDLDGDGFDSCGGGDCGPLDPLVFPGSFRDSVQGGVDGNCDGFPGFDLSAGLASMTGQDVGDGLGSSLVALGDLDGDGLGEVAIGAPTNGWFVWRSGRVYVYSGADLMDGGHFAWEDAVATISGLATGDTAGSSLARIEDRDGDGVADLVVGGESAFTPNATSGELRFFSGADLGAGGDFTYDDSFLSLYGEGDHDGGGAAMAAGDADGDGSTDLLVTAPWNDAGGSSAGRVYLVRGSQMPGSGAAPWAGRGATFTGEAPGDGSLMSVAFVPDLDQDGADEVLIGVPRNDAGGAQAGRAYLFLSSTMPTGAVSLAAADVIWQGSTGDFVGMSVAGLPDVDGDGRGEVVVAAPWAENGDGIIGLWSGAGLSAGAVLGMESADLQLGDPGGQGLLGRGLAHAGDIDADGLPDLLVGSSASPPGYVSGSVYLFPGALLAAGADLLVGDAPTHFFQSEFFGWIGGDVGSAGDIDGDGRDDLLLGSPENDSIGQDVGRAWVFRSTL